MDKFANTKTSVRGKPALLWNNRDQGSGKYPDQIALDTACDIRTVYPISDTQEEAIARRAANAQARKQASNARKSCVASVKRDIAEYQAGWEARAKAELAASRARRMGR